MRHLDIVLCGRSRALLRLTEVLQEMGHEPHLLSCESAFDHWLLHRCDLLIEDGSLSRFTGQARCPQLALRVQSPDFDCPQQALTLHCMLNANRSDWQVLDTQLVAGNEMGNGASLSAAAINQCVDMACLHISRYSRTECYFDELGFEALEPGVLPSLIELDRLAWQHRHNATDSAQILARVSRPFIQDIGQSLLDNAERTALMSQGQATTYASLHAMSVAIQARLLPLLQDHPASSPVIGISLPKGPVLYASILAVIGCGGIYLPLDPAHPAERRAAILGHAHAALLILDDDTMNPVSGLASLDISQLTFTHQGVQGHSQVALAPDQALVRHGRPGDSPCVAIYTSGTTGEPKGVLLTIDNLTHFCAWYIDYVHLGQDSRALQFSTINFDASLLDIFPTLMVGATLIAPDEDQRRDPVALKQLIQQERISHAFLPPAILSILPADALFGITHLVTGGDVCEPVVIERLVDHCQLHNIYGPTETTVLATCRTFQRGDNNRNLGVPIANTRIYLLNENAEPVEEDQSGEIYISGPGIGAGYLNNPAGTAERYQTRQIPGQGNQRMYRTGDLARWTAEGIQIIGRRDNQVKIRGFRVEPEEIENVLRQAQQAQQLAVVVDEQRRILAFFAQPTTGDAPLAAERLREHAQRLLPDYMRPMAYQWLERLPATANGKVDRKALRNLPISFKAGIGRLAPQNETQAWLLKLWCQLLELPEQDISVDDSFFNLGGHSILLSQMLMGIRETFAKGISINRFIEQPTLINLANLVDTDDAIETSTVSPQALKDAEIDPSLRVLPFNQIGDVHKVIVTGSNGFLGVHIVEALLQLGTTEVACLVRQSPSQSAEERFAQALRDNQLQDLDMSRVTVLAADISQPRLGLSSQDYDRLDREFGALIYNAANVNHVLDYESLVKDNVTPVLECLHLCEGRTKKIFNFISTLSACSSVDEQGRVLEQPPAATPPIYIRNGYNLSKWVAERILWTACEKGVAVNLYRPGNIAFNTRTGVCQPHQNRLMLMLKGSLQLKEVPELALNFDLMPVDFLARFIAFHSSRFSAQRAVFNLHNPQPLSWLHYLDAFRDAGHEFEMVPVSQWQQRLSDISSDNALFGVVGFYLNGFEEDIGDISMIEHSNALMGIRNMGEDYPAKSRLLLRKGCEYLKQIDFI